MPIALLSMEKIFDHLPGPPSQRSHLSFVPSKVDWLTLKHRNHDLDYGVGGLAPPSLSNEGDEQRRKRDSSPRKSRGDLAE